MTSVTFHAPGGCWFLLFVFRIVLLMFGVRAVPWHRPEYSPPRSSLWGQTRVVPLKALPVFFVFLNKAYNASQRPEFQGFEWWYSSWNPDGGYIAIGNHILWGKEGVLEIHFQMLAEVHRTKEKKVTVSAKTHLCRPEMSGFVSGLSKRWLWFGAGRFCVRKKNKVFPQKINFSLEWNKKPKKASPLFLYF